MKFYSPYPPISQRQWESSLNEFAELLSQDIELPQIAERMHVTGGTACVLLRELECRYGEARP